MSDQFQLAGAPRESFGKGAARKLRAAGRTPVVVYGHGTDPVQLSVDAHALGLIVRHANALIELEIEGEKQLVLVKDVQKDPVHQVIEHIDLLVVKKGEKVSIDLPVVLVGESFAGTIANLDATHLSVEAEATHIPEHVEVSVEGLEDGARITAADVTLPKGVTLVADPETLVVGVSTAAVADSLDEAEGDALEADAIESETAE